MPGFGAVVQVGLRKEFFLLLITINLPTPITIYFLADLWHHFFMEYVIVHRGVGRCMNMFNASMLMPCGASACHGGLGCESRGVFGDAEL